MSETIKQSGETNRGASGWEEVEAMPKKMPKHMRQDMPPARDGSDGHQPKHMKMPEVEDRAEGATFVMKGVNRDEAPFKTTKAAELSRYRQLLEEAKDSRSLQEATRLRLQLENALGKSEGLDGEFEKINKETNYQEKQKKFGLVDLDTRIEKESDELEFFESRAKKYKGFFGRIRGMFGNGRAERKELQYQIGRVRHSLEIAKKMRKDLAGDLA